MDSNKAFSVGISASHKVLQSIFKQPGKELAFSPFNNLIPNRRPIASFLEILKKKKKKKTVKLPYIK